MDVLSGSRLEPGADPGELIRADRIHGADQPDDAELLEHLQRSRCADGGVRDRIGRLGSQGVRLALQQVDVARRGLAGEILHLGDHDRAAHAGDGVRRADLDDLARPHSLARPVAGNCRGDCQWFNERRLG